MVVILIPPMIYVQLRLALGSGKTSKSVRDTILITINNQDDVSDEHHVLAIVRFICSSPLHF